MLNLNEWIYVQIHTYIVSCFKRETWRKEPRNPSYDKTASSCTALDSKMTKQVTQVFMSSAKQNKVRKKTNKVTRTWCFLWVIKSLLMCIIYRQCSYSVSPFKKQMHKKKSQMHVHKLGTTEGQCSTVLTKYLPYCTNYQNLHCGSSKHRHTSRFPVNEE